MDEKRRQEVNDLRRTFEDADEDLSGSISHKEWSHAIASNEDILGNLVHLGLGEETDLFSQLDAEGDGVLTFDLFFQGMHLVIKGRELCMAKDFVPNLLAVQAVCRQHKRLETKLMRIYEHQKSFTSRYCQLLDATTSSSSCSTHISSGSKQKASVAVSSSIPGELRPVKETTSQECTE